MIAYMVSAAVQTGGLHHLRDLREQAEPGSNAEK